MAGGKKVEKIKGKYSNSKQICRHRVLAGAKEVEGLVEGEGWSEEGKRKEFFFFAGGCLLRVYYHDSIIMNIFFIVCHLVYIIIIIYIV